MFTYPLLLAIDVTEAEVVLLQEIDLLADSIENVGSFRVFLLREERTLQ